MGKIVNFPVGEKKETNDTLAELMYFVPVYGYIRFIRDIIADERKMSDSYEENIRDARNLQGAQMVWGLYHIFATAGVGKVVYDLVQRLQ